MSPERQEYLVRHLNAAVNLYGFIAREDFRDLMAHYAHARNDAGHVAVTNAELDALAAFETLRLGAPDELERHFKPFRSEEKEGFLALVAAPSNSVVVKELEERWRIEIDLGYDITPRVVLPENVFLRYEEPTYFEATPAVDCLVKMLGERLDPNSARNAVWSFQKDIRKESDPDSLLAFPFQPVTEYGHEAEELFTLLAPIVRETRKWNLGGYTWAELTASRREKGLPESPSLNEELDEYWRDLSPNLLLYETYFTRYGALVAFGYDADAILGSEKDVFTDELWDKIHAELRARGMASNDSSEDFEDEDELDAEEEFLDNSPDAEDFTFEHDSGPRMSWKDVESLLPSLSVREEVDFNFVKNPEKRRDAQRDFRLLNLILKRSFLEYENWVVQNDLFVKTFEDEIEYVDTIRKTGMYVLDTLLFARHDAAAHYPLVRYPMKFTRFPKSAEAGRRFLEGARLAILQPKAFKTGLGMRCNDLLAGGELFLLDETAKMGMDPRGKMIAAYIIPVRSLYTAVSSLYIITDDLSKIRRQAGLPAEGPLTLTPQQEELLFDTLWDYTEDMFPTPSHFPSKFDFKNSKDAKVGGAFGQYLVMREEGARKEEAQLNTTPAPSSVSSSDNQSTMLAQVMKPQSASTPWGNLPSIKGKGKK